MDSKAQSSFEYILLLAGILAVIATVYVLLQSGPVKGGEARVNYTINEYENATNTSDYI